jgi:hypothetical protein
MTEANHAPLAKEAGATLYRELASSSPAERTAIALRLLEQHPQGRLELPACDGIRATLDGIDLSRERLKGEHGEGNSPRWPQKRIATQRNHEGGSERRCRR